MQGCECSAGVHPGWLRGDGAAGVFGLLDAAGDVCLPNRAVRESQ
jgi:hypothetical protein